MAEKISATITAVQRRSNLSKNGNLQYQVTTDQGTWLTVPDGAVATGISNSEYAGAVALTIDKGFIVGVATANGEHFTGRQN